MKKQKYSGLFVKISTTVSSGHFYRFPTNKCLKGQYHEIFSTRFFLHQSAPSGPIRGTLGAFRILTNSHVDTAL